MGIFADRIMSKALVLLTVHNQFRRISGREIDYTVDGVVNEADLQKSELHDELERALNGRVIALLKPEFL